MTRQPTPESVAKAREIEGPCRYGQHPSCLSPTCGPCIRTLRCALALDAERAAGRAEIHPVDQDEFYPGGNCWEACMATILGRPLADFCEHHKERTAFHRALEEYDRLPRDQRTSELWRAAYAHFEAYQRAQRTLGFIVVKVSPPTSNDGVSGSGFRPIGAVPRGYSIANGHGPRMKPDGDPIYHSCVAYDGEVVFDPHPSRSGLVLIEEYELLVPIRARAAEAAK